MSTHEESEIRWMDTRTILPRPPAWSPPRLKLTDLYQQPNMSTYEKSVTTGTVTKDDSARVGPAPLQS